MNEVPYNNIPPNIMYIVIVVPRIDDVRHSYLLDIHPFFPKINL
jgi:hypothetical protein